MPKPIHFSVLLTTFSIAYVSFRYGGVEATEPIGLTEDVLDDLRLGIEDRTNLYRGFYHCEDLKLNEELSEHAQTWANHLIEMALNSEFGFENQRKYGVIITKMPRLSNLAGTVVDIWYNKIAYFNVNDGENELYTNKDIAPLTQLLWKSSAKMGVGVARDNYTYYIVAYFEPKGNVEQLYSQNLPKITTNNVKEGKDAQKVFDWENNKPNIKVSSLTIAKSPKSPGVSSRLSNKSLNPSSRINEMDDYTDYSNLQKTGRYSNAQPNSSQPYTKRSDDSKLGLLKPHLPENKKLKPIPSFKGDDVDDFSQDAEMTANYTPKKAAKQPNLNNNTVRPGDSKSKFTSLRNSAPLKAPSRELDDSLMEEDEENGHREDDTMKLLRLQSQNYRRDQQKNQFLQPIGFKDEDQEDHHQDAESTKAIEDYWSEIMNVKPTNAIAKQPSFKKNTNRPDKASETRVGKADDCVNMKPIPGTDKFACMPKYIRAHGHPYVLPMGLNESHADRIRKQVYYQSNHYRKKHGVPSLTLDEQLNNYAQEWANHLAKNHILEHRPKENQIYGENGYKGGSITWDDFGKVAVDLWYNEIERVHENMAEYEFNGKTKIGHMTQLLWNASLDMGVGVAIDEEDTSYVVVNYNPSGNIQHFFLDNLPIFKQKDIDAGAKAQKEFNEKAGSDTLIK